MTRKLMMTLGIVLGMSIASQLIAADTSGLAVKTAMQKLPPIMQALQSALSAKDYFGTAENFMDLAQVIKGLDTVVPPQGDKAKWNQIHGRLIDAAFKGIGACGARDDTAIRQALQDIIKARDEGHALFIKPQ